MRKDLLIIVFIILFAVILFKGTKIQTVDEYYLTHLDDITADAETISLTIRSDAALQNLDKIQEQLHSYIPLDGVILEMERYVLREGDTVFDLLDRAVRHHRIQMEFQRSDLNIYNSVYIEGINYLYEFSCGPLSGWMYAVNGEFPSYGVSLYEPKDGDEIAFLYTCNLGRDLGYEF